MPKTGPGRLDGNSVGIKAALNVPKKNHLVNDQIRGSGPKAPAFGSDAIGIKQAIVLNESIAHSGRPHLYPAGHFDASALHIQHAVNQTKLIHRPPPLPTTAICFSNSNNNNNGVSGVQLRHSVRPGIESRINEFLVSLI